MHTVLVIIYIKHYLYSCTYIHATSITSLYHVVQHQAVLKVFCFHPIFLKPHACMYVHTSCISYEFSSIKLYLGIE